MCRVLDLRREFIAQKAPELVLCLGVTLRGGFFQPFLRELEIVLYSHPVQVHHAQAELRVGVTLLGRQSGPASGFLVALAFLVTSRFRPEDQCQQCQAEK